MSPNKVIGLTGGSGSGKSFAAKIFEEYGALVIDTDKISHGITDSDENVLGKIKETFSEDVFENGKLSRKKLGSLVFSDRSALEKLNGIMHPAITEKVKQMLKSTDKSFAVIDAPLLFSVPEIVKLCDTTLAVCASLETRINRIMLRDGLTREEAERRIASQLPQQELIKLVDCVIVNDGDTENLRREIVGYIGK